LVVPGAPPHCGPQSSACARDNPALCPAPGMLDHVPLGPLPSLHLLRPSLGATLVRRLPRYYEAVRLPAPVHHGRIPWVPCADLVRQRQARCRASRVPRRVRLCMPEVFGPAGSVDTTPQRRLRYCLPRVRSASAPRNNPISGLHTLPAPSPVNASPTPLPTPAHDSGPAWLAGPSLSGTCTLHHCAGFSRHTRTSPLTCPGRSGGCGPENAYTRPGQVQ